MDDPKDPVTTVEVGALTAVVQALRDLPRDSHKRVIEAALVLLGAPTTVVRQKEREEPGSGGDDLPTDIRQLKELKNPKTGAEMAAVVAFYLAEIASGAERKESVDTADMLRYFKQAKFHLPNNTAMLLVNAKNAGYFDGAGGGKYRLNPVGYNLVAHNLPRGSADSTTPKRKPAKKPKPKR